ncbi:MAG: transporter substrate-binding domain-containing protein [Candidatus Limnocylindria bacterium]
MPAATTSAASTQTAEPTASIESAAPSVPTGLDAELASPGHLVSCTDIRGTLMSSFDEDGRPIGVNIELGEAIAARLGLEPQIQDTAFETLIDAVEDGVCDVSISSQHITQTRLERIEMIPITQGTQHVIVRVGNPAGIGTLTDLCGKGLAVQNGSTHVDLILGLGDHVDAGLDAECQSLGLPSVDLRTFEADQDAVEALATGEADAYIGSDFVTLDRPSEFELSVALPPTRNGIGLAKDKPLLLAGVEAALESMFDDGTYLAILREHGVEGISVID